jgi:hypothetical protein
MINLSHMIFILNFVFTILFYVTRWTKQDHTCICFEEFFNQKLFQSNFQFSAAQKSFHVFISFFLFCFGPPVFLLSFYLISYSQSYFFAGPVSSSAQPRIRLTDPISFGHLQPVDVNHRLQPPRPPRRSLLCRLPLAPWSCLASTPSSPLKTTAPHRLPFPIFISRNRRHWSSTAAASLPLTVRLLPPYGPIKGAMRAPPYPPHPPLLQSPPRARNHLPIRASPVDSVEHRRVVISAAPPPSGAIDENPDDLLSLSELSRRPLEPWSGRAALWSRVHHGPRASRGSVIHRPDSWLFLYKNDSEC